MPNVTARPYPGNALLADGSVDITGDLILNNNVKIRAKDNAANERIMCYMRGDNIIEIGDTSNNMYITNAGAVSPTALSTIDGVDISVDSPSSGEGHVFVDPYSYSAVVAGTWAHSDNVSQPRSGYLYNSTRAQNDKIRFTKIYLAKGTYTIMFITATGSAAGILKVDFDGTNKGSVDCYSAGNSYGVQKTIAGVVVAASGLVEVDVYSDTKHASSTNYDMYLTSIVFYRTA